MSTIKEIVHEVRLAGVHVKINAVIAQTEEHRTCNATVEGAIPSSGPTVCVA